MPGIGGGVGIQFKVIVESFYLSFCGCWQTYVGNKVKVVFFNKPSGNFSKIFTCLGGGDSTGFLLFIHSRNFHLNKNETINNSEAQPNRTDKHQQIF